MKRSLLLRVTLLTSLIAASAAASVAVGTGVLADRLLIAREDQRLRELLASLLAEIHEPAEWSAWISEEQGELAPAGVAIALFSGDVFVAGDPLPAIASGCTMAAGWRVCAASHPPLTVLLGRRQDAVTDHREPLAIASVIAVVVTAGLAAFVSRRLSLLAVGPLVRLHGRLESVSPDAPGRADLGSDESVLEVDALRASLRSLLGRLDTAMAKSRRFAADAAHEVRTPLATVSAELELLAESSTVRGDDAASLLRARATLQRLNDLVERLLILAQEASMPLRESVSFAEIVEAVVAALPAAQRSRVHVRMHDDLLTVRGDFVLLQTLFGNAVDNALKFSGTAPITLTVHGDGRVWVQDEGPGVSDPRVFDAFYRAPAARAAGLPGYGIGLALIAHIAKVHGGSAAFLSALRGALLEIRLPVDADTSSATETRS